MRLLLYFCGEGVKRLIELMQRQINLEISFTYIEAVETSDIRPVQIEERKPGTQLP